MPAAIAFGGIPDEVLLGPVRRGAVTRVRFNRGGSSISLRLDFENGSRAAFKPNQAAWASQPRKEIAAYRIDRLLGVGAVAPAVGRELAMADLIAALDPEDHMFLPRLRAEIAVDEGFVDGELSWWIPVIQKARVDGFPIDSTNGVVTWKRYLSVVGGRPIPPDQQALIQRVSDMVLFDFLIDNSDRWSGGNARASADGHTLYFMDNTLSFSRDRNGHPKSRRYLLRVQKFSRSLIARVRALSEADVRRALAGDLGPFERLLEDVEIAALLARRDVAIAYVDDLVARYGEAEVLAFP